jgi:hypothetical protein
MSGTSNPDGEMREEYEFTDEELRGAIRGKYAGHFRAGVAVVVLDPDVAEVFPDAESVNQALRAMASVIRARTAA